MGLEGHQRDQLSLYYSQRNSDRMRHSQFCPASFHADISSFHSPAFFLVQQPWENHAETWTLIDTGREGGFMMEGRSVSSLQDNEALRNGKASSSKVCRRLLDIGDLNTRVG